jgi:hypothetical protein
MSKQFLDTTGLDQVLQSVNQKIADGEKSVFKTDSTWEVASLSVLQGWVSGTAATDSINRRTVNNYDVYLAKDTNAQYYFDSGTWISFAPDLTDYLTQAQSDARYPTDSEWSRESVDDYYIAVTNVNGSTAIQDIVKTSGGLVQGTFRTTAAASIRYQNLGVLFSGVNLPTPVHRGNEDVLRLIYSYQLGNRS